MDLYGKSEIENHNCSNRKSAEMRLKPTLDWCIVLPGLDHLRLNGCKAIMAFLWEPFFKEIAKRLGYLSIPALEVAKKCSDLHKSDQILAVFLQAGSEILAKYYMEYSMDEEKTVQGFLSYLYLNENPNIIFLRDAVFDWVLGYFVFKGGIRKCNIDYVLKGKNLLGELFFALNHPNYRKLCLFMDFDRACMPIAIRSQVDKMVGVKLKGKGMTDQVKLEHFDFCVESANKSLKQNLMSAPSKLAWLVACRTKELFDNIRESLDGCLHFSR